jgi:uncharacterized membrane protein
VIGVEAIYGVAGVLFAGVAIATLRDRANPKRVRTALFWGAYATSLLFGSYLPDAANGVIVVVLVVVGASGLGRGTPVTPSAEERAASAAAFGHRVFVPALAVPALTLAGALALPHVRAGGAPLVDPKSTSVVALGLGATVALVVAVVFLRQPLLAPAREARRLLDLIGWAIVLPQMLAALGGLFAITGVGDRVSVLLGQAFALDRPLPAVVVYTVGMALFTMVMGNAFAAFPVMTAAVGLPILVRRFGGDPAAIGAVGMLSGFSGTLMTPMAANFNIVPAALLELPDEHGVIRAQVPTALAVLLANTLLMYFLVAHGS